MSAKERFIEVYKQHIHREGADKFLEYLQSSASDFFDAPASTRFHGSYKGGLCEHSLNVYDCLSHYVNRERMRETYGLEFSDESIALVSLLHDVCKINIYHPGKRNVKVNGKWEAIDTFEFEDPLPYGHGEKSVYILSGYMRLTREEAFAIRYHMGFAGTEDERNVGKAFEMFPLAFALSVADMEATYFVEGK